MYFENQLIHYLIIFVEFGINISWINIHIIILSTIAILTIIVTNTEHHMLDEMCSDSPCVSRISNYLVPVCSMSFI